MFPELYRAHHDLHSEDLPFWLELASNCAGPIMELGCGAGRVLLPLVRAGHSALGVERDSEMLAVLRGQLDSALPAIPRLVQADFTRVRLALRFGLILMPCNTYSTLQEDERQDTLGMAREHLLPHGKFATAMPNPQMLADLPRRSGIQVEEIFAHPIDGEPVQVSSGWRRTSREFILEWRYDHLLPDGNLNQTSVTVHHQLTPVQTLLNEFGDAGFEKVKLYGDFDFTPYSHKADHLIIVGE